MSVALPLVSVRFLLRSYHEAAAEDTPRALFTSEGAGGIVGLTGGETTGQEPKRDRKG